MALLTCNFWTYPACSLWRHTTPKNHPNRAVTYYQITGVGGKAYLKSATASVAANGFRKKQACFCVTVTYLMFTILEESQPNNTCCLLEISVPCAGIAVEPPATSGTNPQSESQSLRVPYRTPRLWPCPLTLALFQIPLAANKNGEQNTRHSRKWSAVILTSSPYKNKLKEGPKRKETRDLWKSAS